MCMTSCWFSTKRHTRPIYYELKWIIPTTLELNCWECCWVFEVLVELWPESLAFLALITNSLLNVPEGTVPRCVSQSQRRVINVPIFNTGPQFPNECYRFPKWTRATMVTKVDNDPQIGEPISLVVGTCPELNLVKRQVFVTLPATILTKSMVSKTVSASPESSSF